MCSSFITRPPSTADIISYSLKKSLKQDRQISMTLYIKSLTWRSRQNSSKETLLLEPPIKWHTRVYPITLIFCIRTTNWPWTCPGFGLAQKRVAEWRRVILTYTMYYHTRSNWVRRTFLTIFYWPQTSQHFNLSDKFWNVGYLHVNLICFKLM